MTASLCLLTGRGVGGVVTDEELASRVESPGSGGGMEIKINNLTFHAH